MLISIFMTENLTAACLFTLIFAFIALQERTCGAPRWFTISSISTAICAILSLSATEYESPRHIVIITYSMTIINIIAVAIGLHNNYKLKVNWKEILVILLFCLTCYLITFELHEHSHICNVFMQLPVLLCYAVVVRVLILSGLERLVDRLLLVLPLFSCVHIVIRIVFFDWPDVYMHPDMGYNDLGACLSIFIGLCVHIVRNLLLLLGTVSHMLGEACEQSEIDELSKIWNRRGFDRQVGRILARKEDRSPLSVVMGDLDHFKRVNDTYGHEGGDQVIAAVGELLRQHTPKSAIAARMGGEEFVIFMPDTAIYEASSLAETIRCRVRELQFESPKGSWRVTSSFGVAEQLNGHSLYDTMRRADDALYAAKNAGRDRVCIA